MAFANNHVSRYNLSGAIDVIVVEQLDGTYLSTPFHVRFGKYGVFNYDDKVCFLFYVLICSRLLVR